MKPTLSIIIPTYQRENVLVETIQMLLKQTTRADEILIIDQTKKHEPETELQLQQWHDATEIRWIKRDTPSITAAMNAGIQLAQSSHVLFLDDDIIPVPNLVAAHKGAYENDSIWAVVGQVLQPGEEPTKPFVAAAKPSLTTQPLTVDFDFCFHSSEKTSVQNVMAGNLSIRKDRAIQLGGFDENFIAVAYRFETDFAKRIIKEGGEIWFEPAASIKHLRAERGGTRSYLNHLTSYKPDHSVGDYYYALHHSDNATSALWYSLKRILRSVRTKFHLTHPWWIPSKLIGEFRGWLLARSLYRNGRKLIDSLSPKTEPNKNTANDTNQS